jgi:arsenite methyltransferase
MFGFGRQLVLNPNLKTPVIAVPTPKKKKDYYDNFNYGPYQESLGVSPIRLNHENKNITAPKKSKLKHMPKKSNIECNYSFPFNNVPLMDGCTVVDLGTHPSDIFLCSKFVGPMGSAIVIGDSNKHIELAELDYTMVENVQVTVSDLLNGLSALGDNSVDIIFAKGIPKNKENTYLFFFECARILKEGGELCYADIFVNQKIPRDLNNDKFIDSHLLKVFYTGEIFKIMSLAGFVDCRTLHSTEIENHQLLNKDIVRSDYYSFLATLKFNYSIHRTFKITSLVETMEDYDQCAMYKGTIWGYPSVFALDNQNIFIADTQTHISGNTADILTKTRYSQHFEVSHAGVHKGVFINDC